MAELAEQRGISEAVRVYGTTRKTVRKWVRRFKGEGLEGLKNRKKTPKSIPHKMDKEQESRRLKERYKLKEESSGHPPGNIPEWVY